MVDPTGQHAQVDTYEASDADNTWEVVPVDQPTYGFDTHVEHYGGVFDVS